MNMKHVQTMAFFPIVTNNELIFTEAMQTAKSLRIIRKEKDKLNESSTEIGGEWRLM